MFSGKTHIVELPISEEEYNKGMAAFRSGTFIQDAFPQLSKDHREFILTGATPEEWDEAFPPEEEDD